EDDTGGIRLQVRPQPVAGQTAECQGLLGRQAFRIAVPAGGSGSSAGGVVAVLGGNVVGPLRVPAEGVSAEAGRGRGALAVVTGFPESEQGVPLGGAAFSRQDVGELLVQDDVPLSSLEVGLRGL